jgi:hypothetical protein
LQFSADAKPFDDGELRSLAAFTQEALGRERFTSIDRVEGHGLRLIRPFHSDRWGDFITYFIFKLGSDGKVERLERHPGQVREGNNVTKWPPITRRYARSVGEFVVSLPLAHPRNDLRKSLI